MVWAGAENVLLPQLCPFVGHFVACERHLYRPSRFCARDIHGRAVFEAGVVVLTDQTSDYVQGVARLIFPLRFSNKWWISKGLFAL